MSEPTPSPLSHVPSAAIEYRPLTARAELQEAVLLQKRVWGFDDIELLPLRLFVVSTKIGGQVFGAFDAAAWWGSASPFRG